MSRRRRRSPVVVAFRSDVLEFSLRSVMLYSIQLTPVMNRIMSSTGSLENSLSSILKRGQEKETERRKKKQRKNAESPSKTRRQLVASFAVFCRLSSVLELASFQPARGQGCC